MIEEQQSDCDPTFVCRWTNAILKSGWMMFYLHHFIVSVRIDEGYAFSKARHDIKLPLTFKAV